MPATLTPPPSETKPQSRAASSSVSPQVSLSSSPSTGENKPPTSLQQEREELLSAFDRSRLRWNNIDWVTTLWIVAMHLGCLAAPFFFSWTALAVFLVLHWMTCSLGVCLGYHRYLAHRSMKLSKPVEFTTLALGTISGEGTPLMWSAVHRLHHQQSDQKGDPHSPKDGPWWSHLLWLFVRRSNKANEILFRRYCPELMNRPLIRFFERTQIWWLLGTAAVLAGAGYLLGGWFGAISFLVWGVCVRMVVAYHSTWLVNSATHIWGYRNYETRDQSKNLWWVAIFAYGEGWHNNHHAHPSVAPAGHRWWEFDITWWTIKALRFCGLAWDVNDRIPQPHAPAADESPLPLPAESD